MAERPARPEAPRFVSFGRYLLLERLAVGGMAEVYLAKRFEGGGVSDLIAVKRILPSLAVDEEFVRMFLDEAQIAARLEHPGIVRILELGRTGDSHYLAMDFVWGKDLLTIMRRCRLLGAQLSPLFVAWVGASVCEALHHAHEQSDRRGEPMALVHRDVSPQNVLISFDGVVKLIDFGVAKAQSRVAARTATGVLKGKIGYMSPEQVGRGDVDRRSDLFALGTCLYELLTLRSLFARKSAEESLLNVRDVRAEPIRERRPDVPEALAAILHKAHAADPAERWQSGREMQRALLAFIQAEDSSYGRIAAVAWMRDAFRKELHKERHRLDAFDQLGRAQVQNADEPRRNSVTDLEIEETEDPGPPTFDSADETFISDEPIPFVDEEPPPDDGPTEIFYQHHEDEGDVALEPSEIDSEALQSLLPTEPPPQSGPRLARRGWGLRVLVGLALFILGGLGTYALTSPDSTSTIEVRVRPSDSAAVVIFEGVERGEAPLRLEHIGPGTHVIRVRAAGYLRAAREIEVEPGATVIVEIALEPDM